MHGADPPPSSKSRAAILEATGALLAKESLDDLSVAQITKAANTARATFYFYFANKEDAFLALLNDVMGTIVSRFEAIWVDVERRRSPHLRQDIAEWLDIRDPERAVVRSAVEEWPRRPRLRTMYLAGHHRMVSALATAIDDDRRAAIALGSIPSKALAAGWIWTMERSWYEAVGGAAHLEDVPAVNAALAATLVAAVYGTGPSGPALSDS